MSDQRTCRYGYSKEADSIFILIMDTNRFLEEPISRKMPKDKLKEEIKQVYYTSNDFDWDGDEGLAVTFEALDEAEKIVDMLPYNMIKPEIVAEADGSLAIEWYETDKMFSLNVYGKEFVIFTGKIGEKYSSGNFRLLEDIPENVSNFLYNFRIG
jgi:hypothetical protein